MNDNLQNALNRKAGKNFNVRDYFNSQTLSRMTPANSGKTTQRHLQKMYKKSAEFRAKSNYFGHLDERAKRRGEQDL